MTAADPPRPKASFDAAITHSGDDLLGIQPYAARLAEFIDNLVPPFTIGVYGAWGSGKTTFVRLMEDELRKVHHDLKFIVFEAWPFKTSDDLWRALVQKIAYDIHEVTEPAPPPSAKSTSPGDAFATRLGKRLREPAFRLRQDPEPERPFEEYYGLLQRLDDTRYGGMQGRTSGQLLDEEGAVTALVQGTVAALGSLSPLVAATRAFFGSDSKAGVAKLLQQEKNETTRNRIKSVEDFRKAAEELFEKAGKERKVCVFIDDLDRCMPDVALDLLEALKIFLGHTRCIFIVAADEQLIGEGLRIRYKELLAIPRAGEDQQLFPRKGKEYFEKIIQLGIRVPDHSAPHVHRFIAAQFPHWLSSTDLIQTAVGSNPRRLKQYCTWLDYKYMVVRDPKADDDWPLLTKLVELQSRSAEAVEALRRLAREPGFAEQMKGIERGSRPPAENTTAVAFYELAAGNDAVRRALAAPPLFSEGDPAEIAAVAGFVDVVPDSGSTRMLNSRDGVLVRLFERVARTGAPEAAAILDEDLLKLDALVKLDPGLDAILEQLAQRDDWSDVLDSVESSLRGGTGARSPHDAAAALMSIAKANEEVRKKLLEPEQQLSMVLPEIVRARVPRAAAIPADEVERIKAALAVRLRAARHFVKRRKFVKLDALMHSWPELFQYVRSDRAGLRRFESNVADPAQRTQDLPERWQAYARDETLVAYMRLRPYLADILDEEVMAIESLRSAVVRPAEQAPLPPPVPPPPIQSPPPVAPPQTEPPLAVTPPQPQPPLPLAVKMPADVLRRVWVQPEAHGFANLVILIREITAGEYDLQLFDALTRRERGKSLHLDVRPLRDLASNLREFIHSHRAETAGRLREFGRELYQTFFGEVGLEDFFALGSLQRICLSVSTELELLPWELLYQPSLDLFLGLSPNHSLVRIQTLRGPVRVHGSIEPPLRVLAFLGKAGEMTPRLTEEEALFGQLAGKDSAGPVTLEVLSGVNATFKELERVMRVLQPHVLHFSGYRSGPHIHFSDHVMPDQEFISWLAASRVQLVDLTGCYVPPGGMEDSPLFASDLSRGGVPMAIGTTSPITGEAVLLFARDFYRSLAEGRSFEEAMVEARQSQSKERWDWSAFALFGSDFSIGFLRTTEA